MLVTEEITVKITVEVVVITVEVRTVKEAIGLALGVAMRMGTSPAMGTTAMVILTRGHTERSQTKIHPP